MQKRLRDREKELELDERDRKREKDELEEIRQRLLAEGHPDPDAELQRVRMCVRFYICIHLCLCLTLFFCLKDRAGGRETAAASSKARAERGGAAHLP